MKLSNSLNQNKVHYRNYFLLLIICLMAFWPLTFGIFSVKNDAIHYFLPYRFNISEAIRNHEWPFWSPYIYLGYPIHGDMQSGAWNPIVWLFSILSRYNLTVFHYETLLYIFLGSIGMYKLTNRIVLHANTSILIAISYMLSGFMLNGQLINWLASAAFIPFVLLYYLKIFDSPSLSNSIKTGISLYLLFTAGYPSFFILTGYLLILIFLLKFKDRLRQKDVSPVSWYRFFFQQILLVLIFAGLSLPAIISFIDLLPYYQRGDGVNYTDAIINSFEIQHFLSLFFPSAIKASDINSATDVTFRNIYLGIFPIILILALPPKINRRNILLIALALFSILYSLGDAGLVHKLCYKAIPLMNTFRHPSQAKLFFIIAILLLASQNLKTLLNPISIADKKRLLFYTLLSGVILLTITVFSFFNSGFIHVFSLSNKSNLRGTIIYIYENILLADALTINGIIQIIFLTIFFFWIKNKIHSGIVLSILWTINLAIMAQLVLPISFVSQYPPAEINNLINTSEKGFPSKGLEKPIGISSSETVTNFNKIGLSYFYNKKIGISNLSNSPSFLSEQEDFLKDTVLVNYVSKQPIVYIAHRVHNITRIDSIMDIMDCKHAFTDSEITMNENCNSSDTVVIDKLSSNSIEISTNTTQKSFLVLTQNFHHNWKVKIDGSYQEIYKANLSFMGCFLPAGNHSVEFIFFPALITNATWVMIATFTIILILSILSLFHPTKSGF